MFPAPVGAAPGRWHPACHARLRMTPHPSVLVGFRDSSARSLEFRDRLGGWVRGCGYEPRFTEDAEEALEWLRRDAFAVSFLDSEFERARGEPVWRGVQPGVARRVVLMARESRRELMFEALRLGVATVLPLPPVEAMVRAALAVASGADPNRRDETDF